MHPDTKGAEILPSRYSDYPLMAGNIFRLESPGGGGFGDPRKRDPQSVCHDVNEGYVSAKSAKQDYRVALKKSKGAFIVDLPATKALRKAKR